MAPEQPSRYTRRNVKLLSILLPRLQLAPFARAGNLDPLTHAVVRQKLAVVA